MNNLKSQDGFSLLELIVVLVILAIVSATSVAHIGDLGSSFNRWNSRTYIVQDLRYAQTKAISEGCRAIFDIAADAKSYSFGCDYLPYDYSTPYSNDVTFFTRVLPGTIEINTDDVIIFNPKGQIVDGTGDLTTRVVNMTYDDDGEEKTFLTANILATGVFTLD
jgi:prepilin-type N-terminal cleavage/methylation domain-containing protein